MSGAPRPAAGPTARVSRWVPGRARSWSAAARARLTGSAPPVPAPSLGLAGPVEGCAGGDVQDQHGLPVGDGAQGGPGRGERRVPAAPAGAGPVAGGRGRGGRGGRGGIGGERGGERSVGAERGVVDDRRVDGIGQPAGRPVVGEDAERRSPPGQLGGGAGRDRADRGAEGGVAPRGQG